MVISTYAFLRHLYCFVFIRVIVVDIHRFTMLLKHRTYTSEKTRKPRGQSIIGKPDKGNIFGHKTQNEDQQNEEKQKTENRKR